MTTDSPASVLYRSDGYELAVVPGSALPAQPRAILEAGSDGTNAQLIKVDSSGRQVVAGAGTAGTPAGGVITIQGDPSGTAIPVTGSVTVSNASVSANGSTIPASSTQVGGSDGTNLQPIRLFDLDSGGGTQFVLGVGLRKASSGGSVELGTASDPIRVDPTGSTTQPVSGTVAATQSGTWTVQPGNTPNTTPWLITINQGGNSASVTGANALKVDGSAVTQPVSGTVTANIGTSGALALDATLTGGTARTKITDGTNNAAVKAASVAPVAADPALVVAISPNSSILTNADGYATTAAPTYTNNTFQPLSLTTAGALRTDSSATTQPVSGTVAATQSGTWTVQPGNTANTTPWLITINQGGNSATVTAGNALKVDGSAVTQPVSGTVTANIGTTNGLALDATLTGGTQRTKITDGTNNAAVKAASTAPVAADPALVVAISPNSSIVTNVDGYATTAAPSYTNNTFNPLSLTTAGALRIDGSATTQPVSGTVAATQSGTWTVQPGNTANTTPWLATINQGGNSATVTASNALKVDGSAVTQPVSGTVTANQGGTWNINNISGTISLPTGAATETTLAKLTQTQGSTTSGQSGPLVQGAVTTAAPTYTTAQTSPLSLTTAGALRIDGSAVTQPVSGTVTANIGTTNGLALDATVAKLTIAQGTALGSNTQALMGGSVTTAAPTYTTGQINPLSLTTAGALRIDGSGTTQPVSGTVTANQGGTWNITNISGTVSLPTGASTETTLAKLAQAQGSTTSGQSGPLMQGAVTTASPTYTTAQTNPLSLTTAGALRVDGSAVTQPVSGTVTSNQGTANTLANAWSIKITDATNGPAAVKAASTAAGATDPALVVAVSPNNSVSVTQATASNLNAQVVGPGASGSAVSGNPVRVAGSDGTNTRNIATDTSGRLTMVGAAADGAAFTGNPVLMGGQDGTNVQAILTDTSGRPVVVGEGTAGSPAGGIVSTQVPDTTGTGTLNALNAAASVSLTGSAGAAIQLSAGTLIGTIVPEASYDGGTTWVNTLFMDPSTGVYSTQIVFSASNTALTKAIISGIGASNARVRVSAFTSGTATANIRASQTISDIRIPVSQAIDTLAAAIGTITTAATTNVPIRSTTYVEQSSNAQRSVSSSSASDAAAGTGARTIVITYLDSTGAGPFSVTLTMNGTTAVNTGVTNICYVESIQVLTAGSNGSPVGTITLFAATAAGGGAIATINIGENQSFWAHHYLPTGRNCYISDFSGYNNNASSGTIFTLRAKSLNANAAETQISESFRGGGGGGNGSHTTFGSPIVVNGPARVILYGAPEGTGSIFSRGSFYFYDL